MPIRQLPPLLINQIAAGEVIERPASVVKELVENAIDAGGQQIRIEIEAGGTELVRVSDDGCGIPHEELPLALAAHATSKLSSAEDLDAIVSLGFRGEALASILSVSRLSLRTRTRNTDEGWLIEGEGERIEAPRPAGGPCGTVLTVRNLFFNTPARRKFLKTEATESNRVRETVQTIALAHPEIGFVLAMDGREALELPGVHSPRERVLAVVGEDLAGELLEVSAADRGLRLWGMVGTPAIARSTARHLRFFVNGRCISDRSLQHAVREAYRGLIDHGRYPTAVIFLQLDPASVDANVHPAKAEVRFRQANLVHGLVLRTIRERLREADLMPAFDLERSSRAEMLRALPPMPRPEFGSGMSAHAYEGALTARSSSSSSSSSATSSTTDSSAFVEYFRRLDPAQKGFVYTEVKAAIEEERGGSLDDDTVRSEQHAHEHEHANGAMPTFRSAASILQVHSSYIVTEDEQGLVIIDQHALHERVMFEKLRERIERGPLESQRLLMPVVVQADRRLVEAAEELQPLFARLGMEVAAMGPTALAVQAFPTLLFDRKVDPKVFLRELLDAAADGTLGSADTEAAMHRVLDMMACRAAVKAGDRLTEDELGELLRYRRQIERASNCPHGRPTTLRLSLRDLERQFGRS